MSTPAERYRELQECGGVVDLCDRVKLVLTGADRVRYLNGQVTSDVRHLKLHGSQPACVTNAKGKLSADIVISSAADSLIVDAEGALHETLPARLERYIVADDVEVNDATEALGILHVLPARHETLDRTPMSGFGPSRRFGMDGIDLIGPRAELMKTKSRLAADRLVIDAELLEVLRIERGVPRWGFELDESTLPPEAGLDRTHIDFAKGCYIGQEVISRLKSVGHVNRRLVGFLAEAETPLVRGIGIFAIESAERPIGQITSAAWSFTLEKHVALGYLRRGSPERGLVARAPDGSGAEARVTACELPLVP